MAARCQAPEADSVTRPLCHARPSTTSFIQSRRPYLRGLVRGVPISQALASSSVILMAADMRRSRWAGLRLMLPARPVGTAQARPDRWHVESRGIHVGTALGHPVVAVGFVPVAQARAACPGGCVGDYDREYAGTAGEIQLRLHRFSGAPRAADHSTILLCHRWARLCLRELVTTGLCGSSWLLASWAGTGSPGGDAAPAC